MTEPERAWLAGFFDGEGSVSIFTQRPARSRTYLAMQVSITQKSAALLEQIRDDLGFGKIVLNQRGISALRLTRPAEIRAFVKLIYPYARHKRPALRLAYAFFSSSGSRRDPRDQRRLADSAVARRTEIALRLREINARERK